MAKRKQEIVIAEVLLGRRDPAAIDKVRTFLQERGVEVSGVGAAAMSIRCARRAFEQLFRVRLKKTLPPIPRRGVNDFGPLKHAIFRTEQTIRVPDEIANEVEGVYLQEPPRLL